MQFDLPGLQDLMEGMGEKRYRGRQLADWIYVRGAEDFMEMDTLPLSLRGQLEERYALSQPRVLQSFSAEDGTTRALLELGDGERTETVVIFSGRRVTVCFSTQVGCSFDCVFCATGSLGFSRSLMPGEMVAQVTAVSRNLNGTRVSNVVSMGQGEPFANYEATLSALRMMNSPELFDIGARHITVSTAGLVPKIMRFADEPEQFTLAVSLHSAEQQVRDYLMPNLASHSLRFLRNALVYYMEKTSRRPSLEYALIEGVNESPEALASLLAFCQVPAPGFHVNLLALHEVADATTSEPAGADRTGSEALLRPARHSAFRRFESALADAHISVSRRVSKGTDIAAACGQLSCRGFGADQHTEHSDH